MAPHEQDPFDLAYRCKTAAVKILLNENPNLLKRTDQNDRTLLHWAALGGADDLVKYLLSLGSATDPVDDVGMTPLILASSAGRDKVVNILLNEGAKINATNEDGHSSLQYAASKNWKSVCVALLNHHADVNIVDKRGATPLQRCASKGNLAIVKLLLDQGKNLKIDQRDIYGNSALHLACEENRVDEAYVLVEYGADLKLTNKERQTPLDLASIPLARKLIEIHESICES